MIFEIVSEKNIFKDLIIKVKKKKKKQKIQNFNLKYKI